MIFPLSLNFLSQWQLIASGATGHLGAHGMTTMAVATVIVPDMFDGISQMGASHAPVAESTYNILITFCCVTIVTNMVDICPEQLECM